MAGKTIPLRKSNGQFNGSKSRSGGHSRGRGKVALRARQFGQSARRHLGSQNARKVYRASAFTALAVGAEVGGKAAGRAVLNHTAKQITRGIISGVIVHR